MSLPACRQGRPLGPMQLAQITLLLVQYPEMSGYKLSREVALMWNWRTAGGQRKDMAARTLLLKLQQRGWIQLPARRMASPTRSGRVEARDASLRLDETPLECRLPSVSPLLVQEVSQLGREGRREELEECLRRYHYLGYRSRVGQNLQYWVGCGRGRPLACMVFGVPAGQCAARDQWS